jgi:membrane-associated phospholipid phosphatase
VFPRRIPADGVDRRPLSAGYELALVAAAWLTYFGIRAVTEGKASEAIARGRAILGFERDLGLAWEHDAQRLLSDREWLLDLANWIYIWGHWPVIAISGIWLYRRHPPAYRRLRDAILISGTLGLAIFALFPVAPPRLIDAGVLDTVTQHSTSYRALQPPALTNVYAAMPSLHFGWNLIVAIALTMLATTWWLRCVGLALPLAMAFAVVATGNHFVIDVVAGGTLAMVGLAAAIYLQPTIRDTPGPNQAGAGTSASMRQAGRGHALK